MTTKSILALVLASVALALAACGGSASNDAGPSQTPDDFALTYDWEEGSLPPAYHYEFTIEVGPDGRGRIRYSPTYSGDGVPVWTRSFTVAQGELDRLYRLFQTDDLFRSDWPEPDDRLVGGPSASLSIVADGKRYSIPASLTEADAVTVSAASEAITALVPKAVWNELELKRTAYVAAHDL